VNSGPRQAIRWLQRAAGAKDDGIIGPKTLAAVRAADPEQLVRRMLAQRLRFMTGLPNWPAFGRGWARRIADLMET
jgi:lysozyme family protein